MGQKLINLIIKIAGSIHLKYHRPKNLNSNLENIRIRARLLSSGCCQHKNGRKCSQNFYQKEEKNVLTEKKNHIHITNENIARALIFSSNLHKSMFVIFFRFRIPCNCWRTRRWFIFRPKNLIRIIFRHFFGSKSECFVKKRKKKYKLI